MAMNEGVKIHIKNMVCGRCITAVRGVLERLEIEPLSVELGEVRLAEDIDAQSRQRLSDALESLGFSLIDNRRSQLIERVKNLVINLVHYDKGDSRINLSDYLAKELNLEYNYLSNLFSEATDTTIEKYYIAQKIERVKELLVYDELTLSQIAHQLNYSSLAHLSAQFKRVTGFTPSHYRAVRDKKRKTLDEV